MKGTHQSACALALCNLIIGQHMFDGNVKRKIDAKVVSGDFADMLLP